ncbi:hypothetical protein [Rhodococcus qingshengii]|uniref:hypothetical protein n=1 Tax=Rhodococcus qingshengii TaxID=334542 RepID=UPI0033C545D4
MAEAVALFAPLGWAMCGHWHVKGTLAVLRQSGSGATDDEIDEAITEVWNTENATWLKHAATPIRRWSNSHHPFKQILWDRVRLIEKAIEHHFNGAYEASIPIILAQIDGMSRDLTGQSFFSKGNRDPYLDDETIAGMEINLPVVRGLFSEDVRPTGDYGKLSRHGVLHGRDLGYATKVNSTKTIVLIAALAEYLPKIADDAGAQLRRKHEDDVAGSGELDELGRFVDDRQVPELLNFAYDLDTEYLDAVLLNPGPFDTRRKLATAARKHGLDAEAFTLEGDHTGWRWHYTIPAGQTLGYTARPSTSIKRRHPDVWRWDEPAAPTAFPWDEPAGWRSDDDPPRSPHWEPKIVM